MYLSNNYFFLTACNVDLSVPYVFNIPHNNLAVSLIFCSTRPLILHISVFQFCSAFLFILTDKYTQAAASLECDYFNYLTSNKHNSLNYLAVNYVF